MPRKAADSVYYRGTQGVNIAGELGMQIFKCWLFMLLQLMTHTGLIIYFSSIMQYLKVPN